MKYIYHHKYRMFNTDIYTIEFNPAEFVFEAIQMENRTRLTDIFSGWWKRLFYKKVAGINGSFFPFVKKASPLGLNYLYEGVLISDSHDVDEFMELVFDGNLHIEDSTFADILAKFPNIKWGLSLGHLLVLDGKENLRKSEMFPHAKYKHPRTMVGQKKKNIVLAVAEGRNPDDEGLTDKQQATFMISIGCQLAINADGGGSSTMELEGRVVNYLSDGVQRAIANGLFVYCKGSYEVIAFDHTKIEKSSIEIIGQVMIHKNISLEELACRHCGKVKFLAPYLTMVGQTVRDYFGKAMRFVGYRCIPHNKAIGGDDNSGHIYGLALDISSWNDDVSPRDIYEYIITNFPLVEGIGLYIDKHGNGHVHIDLHHNGERVTWENIET